MQGKFDNPVENLKAISNACGCSDPLGAERQLQRIVDLGLPNDLVEDFFRRLTKHLPTSGEVDRNLSSLVAFIGASLSPLSLLALFEREPESLSALVKLIAASSAMADQLIADPAAFDLLRVTEGQPIQAGVMADELLAEVHSTNEFRPAIRAIRAFRSRETLRIAYGDIIGGLPVETISQQLTALAEAVLQAAVVAAERELEGKRERPLRADRQPARFAIIALGMLGGAELNYSTDLELLFVSDDLLETHPGRGAPSDYFERLTQLILRILSGPTPGGSSSIMVTNVPPPLAVAYHVDARMRPGGINSPMVIPLTYGLHYYDSSGRTWQRQAFVKARYVAGDCELGNSFLEQLQPWVYRRYLNRADITGIAALKRRIEKQTSGGEDHRHNVKLCAGGIRDIEFVIQFLQLLNGGDLAAVRDSNTLAAIQSLEAHGCLTMPERETLATNYRFLRRLEHYLQIMFESPTQVLPGQATAAARLATQLGYVASINRTAQQQLLAEVQERTAVNQRILNHLLHDAFADDEAVAPESDLVLDPEPDTKTIREVLAPHGFREPQQAYRHLTELSRESISFLSTRRCRHFLSAIAPKLLSAIAATPNPDATLVNLAHVSESLGGKAVLWELFMANPPSMELCIRLCACSPYLVSILTSNPGMMDELLDSLMLDCLPSYDELDDHLTELCRRAEDITPMLHSFKNSMHLRVGVRDILGKEQIAATHATLSDIAEVCLKQIVASELHRLVQRLGVPILAEGPRAGETAELIVLAVGKLGGREPNYHSDLDVIFLFEGEGNTRSLLPTRKFQPTSNRHFFNQLSQRVVHAVTRTGTQGRLYDLDVQLRPLGSSGELAITIDDLRHYFAAGAGRAWERQALCKARAIWGSPVARDSAMDCVQTVLRCTPPADLNSASPWAEEIFQHRLKLEADASRDNIKRGVGGTMDIEFIVQMLQLASAAEHPRVLVPGTLDAIERLRQAEQLNAEIAQQLSDNYQFLRSVESGLRLMNTSARHDLPTDKVELDRLAFLIAYRESTPLGQRCRTIRQHNRKLFHEIFSRWLTEPTNVD